MTAATDTAGLLRAATEHASVLVVGALNMDYLLTAERMPGNDGSTTVDLVEAPGGHAGNCAAALSALGVRVALLAAVGEDGDGRALLADLRSRGVGVGHVRVCPDLPTGRVVIPITPDFRCMLMHRGANAALRPADLEALDPRTFDAVVVFDPPWPVVDSLVAWVRRATSRMPVYWTPAGVHSRPELRASLGRIADVVIVNCDEFSLIFGDAEPGEGYLTVLTLGAGGSRLYAHGRTVDVPAIPVEARDVTGAGDAFVAGLVLGRRGGLADHDALRLANAVGALATRRPGARGSVPSLAEALSCFDGRGP